jgi:hypothetical protein
MFAHGDLLDYCIYKCIKAWHCDALCIASVLQPRIPEPIGVTDKRLGVLHSASQAAMPAIETFS